MSSLDARLRRLEAQQQAASDAVMRQLTDGELEAIIAAAERAGHDGSLLIDPAWVAAHLTDGERAALDRLIILSEREGYLWRGTQTEQ